MSAPGSVSEAPVPSHPLDLPVQDLGEGYRAGAFAPTDVVAESLRRVEGAGTRHGAVTEVLDGALIEARELTAELGAGRDRGPLHGVPIVVKELIDLAGRRRTAGTHVRPPDWTDPAARDAAVVALLREAGAVVVARGRTHEFAWGITSRHPDGSGVTNPLAPDLVAGGSSGGVAALLAAGCAPVGIGTDTGGSVRIPAAFCGLVGWKPAIGRLSTRGVVPLAPTFDHVGVLARTVEDAVVVDTVLGGGLARQSARDIRPGRAVELEDASLPPVARVVGAAVRAATGRAGISAALTAGPDLGQLPPAVETVEAYAVLQRAEALAIHRDVLRTWPQQAEDYGDDVAGRLREAEQLDAGSVVAARLARREVQARWHQAFTEAESDVLVLPGASCGPPSVAAPDTATVDGRSRPLRDAVMPFTIPADVTGWPALVVPVGPGVGHLPASAQLVARPGAEHHLAPLADLLGG